MSHRGGVVIGAVVPAQVDGFVEFSEQANDPGQHIEELLAVMANPVLELLEGAGADGGAVRQHLLFGQAGGQWTCPENVESTN